MTTKPTSTPAADSDAHVDHDVAVVGGGAAGLAAAVFTARYGLETTVFDGGTAAITQCAHIENYLGFPGGIDPDRFLALGRAHATHEGTRIVDERVTEIDRDDRAFLVETAGRETVADRVVVAAAYDDDVLDPLLDELPQSTDGDDSFVRTDAGRTDVDGLYVAGWQCDETVHQVNVNAGHGARTGLAVARDEMSERYWPALGERYLDWTVPESRYGGDGWEAYIDEWFDDELRPDDRDPGPAAIDDARGDLKAELLDRCIDEAQRGRRDRDGQRRLLEQLDDEVVLAYAESLECESDV